VSPYSFTLIAECRPGSKTCLFVSSAAGAHGRNGRFTRSCVERTFEEIHERTRLGRRGTPGRRSRVGRLHSDRTARTAPDRNSGLNIHSDAMVSPASASTAALTPSAAVTRNLLWPDRKSRPLPARADAGGHLRLGCRSCGRAHLAERRVRINVGRQSARNLRLCGDPARSLGHRLPPRRRARIKGTEEISHGQAPIAAQHLRPKFSRTLIAAGGFAPDSAEAIVAAGDADLVAFGRHFISNPDLPERLRHGLPLNRDDRRPSMAATRAGTSTTPRLRWHRRSDQHFALIISRPARAHRRPLLAYARQSDPLRRSSPASRRRELQALRRRPGRTAPPFCATGQE
jgi:NADH:flavin oxidoreductase / NADH oxidase family